MRFFTSLLLCAFAAPAAATTTVTVSNLSGASLRLHVEQPLAGYERNLDETVPPGDTALASKPGGKVLATKADARRSAFAISYLDDKGSGCRFSASPVRHTTEMALIVPAAEPVGDRRCEARTGSTIGDFVFVVR